jgi:uncharacterized protein (TIGR00255 family)
MQSMTGFGAVNRTDERGTLQVQIASVNNRSCQIHLRGDLRDLSLEEQIKRQLRERLMRGSISVQIVVQSARPLVIDTKRLLAAWQELANLAKSAGAPVPALEQVASLQSFTLHGHDADFSKTLLGALDQAIDQVITMRSQEGRALLEAFRTEAAWMRKLWQAINEAAHGRAARHQEALLGRLQELLKNQPIGDDVLVRELALYSDRVDVTEETVRLASHLDALELLLSGREEAVGRKLEFLLQEFGREINTIGSKSNDAALTKLVLEAKSVLERMREQSANVA